MPTLPHRCHGPAPGPARALLPCLAVALLLAGAATAPTRAADLTVTSDGHTARVETLSNALRYPWGMAFLPDGAALITERGGALRLWAEGRLEPRPIAGVPDVWASGQGGLLDVLVHPDFADNGWIYLSFSHSAGRGAANTRVVRATLDRAAHALREVTVIVDAGPPGHGGRHFGSRMAIGGDGKLYISTGERGDRPRAQRLDDLAGKILRLNLDGSIPDDNPFVGEPAARPEIYASGTRNAQGMDVHPETGAVWFHEHGPRGGDELNVARAGANYGWPVITHGVNYSGTPMGEGTHKPGMTQPVTYWDPSIAPSGMAIYDGDLFPNWRGDIFVGALKYRLIARLEMGSGGQVVAEDRLLEGDQGRIRALEVGPDGALYILTDSAPGSLLRLVPAT